MSTAFEQIFDEPTAVDAATPPKKFKVAPTFVIAPFDPRTDF